MLKLVGFDWVNRPRRDWELHYLREMSSRMNVG